MLLTHSGPNGTSTDLPHAVALKLVTNYCIFASTSDLSLFQSLVSWELTCYRPLTAALLWFDFALTFAREVKYVWKNRFTGATLVYLGIRYFALIDRVFFLLEVLDWNSSNEVGLRHCAGVRAGY